MTAKSESLSDLLQKVLKQAEKSETVTYETLLSLLAGKGYAALLILLSFPFCFPLQIPGFSTPFGLTLAFIGLRIAFGKRPWWPQWILRKEISSEALRQGVGKAMGFLKNLQKVVKPRLIGLIANPFLYRLHGFLIFLLALFLSLPLPIPLTNTLAALPILCIGLGMLEDDGIAMLVGYGLAMVCFSAFAGLFIVGKQIWPW